jgi:molecular chaperone GrpE
MSPDANKQQGPAPDADAPAAATGKSQGEPDQPIKVVDRRWWARGEDTASGEADGQPRKPGYVEQLEQQLAEKDAQLRDLVAKYRDAGAEFDNARARMRRDLAKDVERARRAFLVELLDVLDNLDRAIQSASTSPQADSLLEGVEMVRAQFLAKFEGLGVRRVPALGATFDPRVHEAVTTIATSDPAQDGMVTGVITEGYAIGEEVLRPALVAVARMDTGQA